MSRTRVCAPKPIAMPMTPALASSGPTWTPSAESDISTVITRSTTATVPRTIGSSVRSRALASCVAASFWSMSDATTSQITSAIRTMASACTAPRSRRIHSASPEATASTFRPNAYTSRKAAPMMRSARSARPTAAAVGRALRALLIIGAAFLLVYAFGLNVDAVASGDALWMRLLRGAVQALAIVLIADVIWLVVASLIDQKLAATQDASARLRTLLPIVRGTVAVVLLVMTVLMSLSALGVQVGPLLASAGVIGIAIGFGAQTLVRDMFSKFFYLLDDAFRVGEYIQSGNYKGTVEHLGVRSVVLRHHRGPVYTIPYGQLGAVQNMSRDWVIDKLTIGVTYDSDLDKAKKLIKKIGKDLAADPEFAPSILEPLKMQGVEQFGDFAIQIRMKMMTKPGQQFSIRRRAHAMIKQAFDANGIKFATPTVQVAGGGAAEPAAVAAVRQVLERDKAAGET